MTADQPVRNINDLLAAGKVDKLEKMLGPEEKGEYAESGAELIVTDIRTGDDAAFGPFWEVKARIGDQPVTFRMSYNDRRDAFISSLAAIIADGPIGGLRLKAYPAKGGNDFIALEPM